MQANPRNADCVFQDVDPFLSVEGTHSFQGFQAEGHVEVAVIAQPVCESAHALFFEQTLASLPFIPSEHITILQE